MGKGTDETPQCLTHEIGLYNIFNLSVSVLQKRPTMKDTGVVDEYCDITNISLYNFSTVLGVIIKCKQYSVITTQVESPQKV